MLWLWTGNKYSIRRPHILLFGLSCALTVSVLNQLANSSAICDCITLVILDAETIGANLSLRWIRYSVFVLSTANIYIRLVLMLTKPCICVSLLRVGGIFSNTFSCYDDRCMSQNACIDWHSYAGCIQCHRFASVGHTGMPGMVARCAILKHRQVSSSCSLLYRWLINHFVVQVAKKWIDLWPVYRMSFTWLGFRCLL